MAEVTVASARPLRVQLSRSAGWRMPANTIKVARPGIWGNPFKVSAGRDAKSCVRLFRIAMLGTWETVDATLRCEDGLSIVYGDWLARFERHGSPPWMRVRALKGWNLACFCRLDQPCHADVLLELANAP
jgi:Domain of unknown function (DUF4326)